MVEHVVLYLSESNAVANRLVAAVRAWCETALTGKYRLDVVDIGQWPIGARQVPVLAVPALLVESSGRTVVGDLSDIPATMAILGFVGQDA